MNAHRFDALHTLRARRAERVQQELALRRAQEEGPRAEAARARAAVQAEIENRVNFANRLAGGAAPASAADQLAGRACLVRMDGQVVRATQVAALAADSLVRAVQLTRECAERLRRARAAQEKSRHSAERERERGMQRRLRTEDAELDEETELQLMTRRAASPREQQATPPGTTRTEMNEQARGRHG